MVLAKPHCGLIARREASKYLAASSARRRSRSSGSSCALFELTNPSTTPFDFGTKRKGAKSSARGVSNSSLRGRSRLPMCSARKGGRPLGVICVIA